MSNELIQFLNPYSNDVYLPSIDKSVSIKAITTGQMKKLMSYDTDDIFTVEEILDEIINGCITTKEFDIDNISIQDRFELLFEIRKITKGNVYNFTTKCENCSVDIYNVVNLSELKVKEYPKDIDYVVKLTDTLSVKMRMITRGDQKWAINAVKNNNDLNIDQKMAEMGTYMYVRCMEEFITPAGTITNASTEDKKELLDNLDTSSYEKLNDWFASVDYGTVFTYCPKCKKCGWSPENNIDIPLTGFFF